MSHAKQKTTLKNIGICNVCNYKYIKKKSTQKTCSKACGYKYRTLPPNKTQFKKGQKPWNFGILLSDDYKAKLSEARLKSIYRTGKLHPKWKGGTYGYYSGIARKVMIENKVDKKCTVCSSVKNIHTHHIDKNRQNNQLSNLKYLCGSCHLKLHHSENRTCVCSWCKNKFLSGRIKRMYCSQACRRKSTKLRKLNTRNAQV